jgi:signal transduction histidine kinase
MLRKAFCGLDSAVGAWHAGCLIPPVAQVEIAGSSQLDVSGERTTRHWEGGETAIDQMRTGRPHRRGELGQRARSFAATADPWPRRRARERLEAHLRHQHAALEVQNRYLQEVNRLQTTVVAHVSHELRTPLTAIIGALELVLEEVGPLTGRQRELLDIAKHHAERLVDLFEELLDLSRLEAGRAALKTSELDVVRLISEVGGIPMMTSHQRRSGGCRTVGALIRLLVDALSGPGHGLAGPELPVGETRPGSPAMRLHLTVRQGRLSVDLWEAEVGEVLARLG